MSSYEHGRAIPVLIKKDNKFLVDSVALKKILLQPELKNVRLSVISIAGAFRKGKSFMLNFFLRYLKERGYEKEDDQPWLGVEEEILEGFDWSGGSDAVTSGILMWNKVFMMKKNGEKVAVILMDTQGLFDNKTDTKSNTLIFAMSTLISSVQVFNLSQQIQENDFQFLQYFTEYAKACKDVSGESDVAPFQTLVFLIRDWQNPDDFEFGFDGGEEYLEKILHEKTESAELDSVRKHIRESFENIKCCLLPHPGKKVAETRKKRNFTGKLKDIDEEFVEEIPKFVKEILHPDNLVIKTAGGGLVYAETLLAHIVKFGDYAEGGLLLDAGTLMEVQARNQNLQVGNKCVEEYEKAMDKVLDLSSCEEQDESFKEVKVKFMEEEELKELHQYQEQHAYETFEKNTKFGPEDIRAIYRDNMKNRIDDSYNKIRTTNDLTKALYKSGLEHIVEELVNDYRKIMQKKTRGDEPCKEEEFEEYHEKLLEEKIKDFQGRKMQANSMKRKYAETLKKKTLEEFSVFEHQNYQKIKEGKEQNAQKKKLMSLVRIEAMNYKSKMDLPEYQEVRTLMIGHNTEKLGAITSYQIKCKDAPEEMVVEQEEELMKDIEKLYEYFIQRNVDYKETLKSDLRVARKRINQDFTNYFQVLLRTNYQRNMQSEFYKKVRKYIEAEEQKYGGNVTLDVYQEHIAELKRCLDDKFCDVNDRNEKNEREKEEEKRRRKREVEDRQKREEEEERERNKRWYKPWTYLE